MGAMTAPLPNEKRARLVFPYTWSIPISEYSRPAFIL